MNSAVKAHPNLHSLWVAMATLYQNTMATEQQGVSVACSYVFIKSESAKSQAPVFPLTTGCVSRTGDLCHFSWGNTFLLHHVLVYYHIFECFSNCRLQVCKTYGVSMKMTVLIQIWLRGRHFCNIMSYCWIREYRNIRCGGEQAMGCV